MSARRKAKQSGRKTKTAQETEVLEGDDLASAVTVEQWTMLRQLGYKGPSPASGPQAAHIIALLTAHTVEVKT